MIYSKNNPQKAGLIIGMIFILLPYLAGCRSGMNNSFSTSTRTIANHTITNAIVPMSSLSKTPSSIVTPLPTTTHPITIASTNTLLPTVNVTYSIIKQWFVNLIFDKSVDDNQKSFLDLDTMQIGENPQSDLRFDVGGGTTEFFSLSFLNGAKAKSMGATNISLTDCKQQIVTINNVDILEIYTGNHVCVQSNLDRIFLLRIEGGGYSSNGLIVTLRLFITTDM